MAITPSTDLYLLKLPIELDNANQLTFTNATAQYNYFSSLQKIGETDFTYQRRDSVIRYPAHIDSIIEYNYVMYRNDNYSNKWFYAYVTNMEYVNDNMTLISIEEDPFQTWQFNLTYNPSFIIREHTNDDTVGKNTIPEGLELGEYVRGKKGADYSFGNSYYLCFQLTELISNMETPNLGGRKYNGIYSGLHIVMTDDITVADNLIAGYDEADKHDAIVSMFYAPKAMFNSSNTVTRDDIILHSTACTLVFPKATSSEYRFPTVDIDLLYPTDVDGYIPKNNKLFTYPFSYIHASNNSGADAVYHWEDWLRTSSSTGVGFYLDGVLTQGCSIRLFPSNAYKYPRSGNTDYTNGGYGYGIQCGKLPICAWTSDYYTNWQTQNAVNIPVDTAQTVLGSTASGAVAGATIGGGAGAVVGGALGLIGSGIKTAIDYIKQKYSAELVPNQAKGSVNAGDINLAEGKIISIYSMNVRREFAEKIDNFLSMYGYATNNVKIPNITGRRNWNYVQANDASVHAYIPQASCDKIKMMLNNGVTFWHNPATFLDYSQDNSII